MFGRADPFHKAICLRSHGYLHRFRAFINLCRTKHSIGQEAPANSLNAPGSKPYQAYCLPIGSPEVTVVLSSTRRGGGGVCHWVGGRRFETTTVKTGASLLGKRYLV